MIKGISAMANKETQTSLSPQSTLQSGHDSASMRTMFDDDDPYDVTDALESNEGSAESKPDKSPNEKEDSIVNWDGPNDPAWHPISLLRVWTAPLIRF
jgi:DHA1 family multidrug resistance protein-like MFS transporter